MVGRPNGMSGKHNAPRKPHPLDIRVAVKRHHHGWEDDRLEGEIIRRAQRESGSWRYVVRTDDGGELEIDHTRDLVPIGGR